MGFTVLLLGAVMIATAGPGWLFILLGLSILSVEFVWARRLIKRIKQTGKDLSQTVFGKEREVSPHHQES